MYNFTKFLMVAQPYAIAIVFILTYAAEHIIPERKESIDHKHDFKNIAAGLINLFLIAFVGFKFQQVIEWFNSKNFGILRIIHFSTAVQTIIGVLCIDLFMYWWHRANHEWKFLWFFHKFHHKDEKLNSTSGFRFHSGELLLSYVFKLFFFALMGINVLSILLHSIIFFPIVLFHHSNLKISERLDFFLRNFLVTPRMHRIHHSVIKSETNSNYSSLLPYWDIIFHSYIKRPAKSIKFGV